MRKSRFGGKLLQVTRSKQLKEDGGWKKQRRHMLAIRFPFQKGKEMLGK
jgi:hypothetical protein